VIRRGVASPRLDELHAATVLDQTGAKRPLGELIAGAPTLLVFLRHFG
jgi:hypothetical protein